MTQIVKEKTRTLSPIMQQSLVNGLKNKNNNVFELLSICNIQFIGKVYDSSSSS